MYDRVRKGLAAALLAVVLLMPMASVSAAAKATAPYLFMSFDYPGAIVTQAYGINPGGDIVGTYQGATDKNATTWPGKQSHGFVLSKGEFTKLDYPGGDGKVTDCTIPTSIAPDGDIAGYYSYEGEAFTSGHGFILTKQGEWTAIPNLVPGIPEPTMTPSPFRILPNGMTVG